MASTNELPKKRKYFSTEAKAAIIKAHLVDKIPISDLCDKHGVQPSVIYSWLKHLWERLPAVLEAGGGNSARRPEVEQLTREVDALKARLAKKDAVIAEISEEYVSLKKTAGEP